MHPESPLCSGCCAAASSTVWLGSGGPLFPESGVLEKWQRGGVAFLRAQLQGEKLGRAWEGLEEVGEGRPVAGAPAQKEAGE